MFLVVTTTPSPPLSSLRFPFDVYEILRVPLLSFLRTCFRFYSTNDVDSWKSYFCFKKKNIPLSVYGNAGAYCGVYRALK